MEVKETNAVAVIQGLGDLKDHGGKIHISLNKGKCYDCKKCGYALSLSAKQKMCLSMTGPRLGEDMVVRHICWQNQDKCAAKSSLIYRLMLTVGLKE
jgi:hypothetical protein